MLNNAQHEHQPFMTEAYHLAQKALADLKAAVRRTLENGDGGGLTNAEIGRTLGIYAGHVGHEGHISRTILAVMESEGVVSQNATTKRWSIRIHHLNSEGKADEPETPSTA
jgi:hypothetical protein